jgi:signal transduction histidine kinase
MNLLMNAVQAIKEHGRITIRTGQEGGNVWVEVEDTGSGIEPKNLSRVFDPFFTTKPVGKGTGLGLSLSYSIVQKHGGKIELRSELGKGTVFKVILPLQADSETGVTHTNGATPDIKQISI